MIATAGPPGDPALPNEQTLHAKPWKGLSVAAGSALFVAGGIWMLGRKPSLAWWAVTTFFGLWLLAGLVLALRGARLELDREGFRQLDPLRRRSFRWDQVSAFVPHRVDYQGVSIGSWVAFRIQADPDEPNGRVVWTQLSDTFGLRAEALAQLLNAHPSRALGE